ncbi:glycoside hydrolase family 113 [Humisphaera borealis]|uniref:Uncharacterized protein n=1 Tax=Humisphaera borealis TaxID=2807512 RepID=A0A7M2X4B4_9BACT|nr:hypothetical protein [Humisphaera borealis]QOV92282.1 hypothetical protein IPV69_13355 [Humisphaera borealis]
MWKAVITTAVVLYAAVMGCVLMPGGTNRPAPTADPVDAAPPLRAKLTGLPLRGIATSMVHPENLPAYFKVVDEVVATGADTIEIVVAGRQENGSSTQIFVDQRYTASKEQLLELFAYAKKKNLRVMLMPIVLLTNPRGNEWRGTIKPDLWADWFDNYRAFIGHYADVAAAGKVDVLVVGSELVSTEVHAAEWKKTISMVREKFPAGMLTYSSNWDHYANIPFWEQLDFIAMNSYWALGKDNQVTVPEIMVKWKEIQKELINFSNKKGKPIVFSEVGWCSISNAADEPWDYTKTSLQPDWELQRKLYEAFFRSWYGNPNLGGFMIWEWHPYPVTEVDKTYIPKGKPAYNILKEWMSKGPWDVK